jgi:extracellular elastinolytic metalloproteinase
MLLRLRLWSLTGLILISFTFSAEAQTPGASARETALRFLQTQPGTFGLQPSDVGDVRVTDEYVSKNNGLTHVWVQQQYAGIPVYNALFGLHVRPDGQVFHQAHRFVADLKTKINVTAPSLSAAQAVEMAKLHLGFEGFATPGVQQKINDRNWIFEGGAISKSPIPVNACYEPRPSGLVRLAWMLVIEQANSSDVWSLRVDAQSGEILSKHNRTVYCKAGHVHAAGDDCAGSAEAPAASPTAPAAKASETFSADETYNVFAFPVESPSHGNRQLLTNPADVMGSPFGWLDANGVAGPEYGYTRGNNVWAYEDSADDNAGSSSESAQAVGGSAFDFPFNANGEPDENRDAAITNLFYVNNMMHDITYRFGFDEAAGNFQVNNYGHNGAGGDEVRAEGLDGGGEDNANFSTPPDGGNGRMQMYRWSRQGGNIVRANAPGAVIGTYFGQSAADWGAPVTTTAVTGDVIIADDGTASGTLGCNNSSLNAAGKIMMVDRGGCEFGLKALNAQNAGAVGCIICNFEDATIGMAAGVVGAQVDIPVVMLKKSDCDLLRQYAGSGLNISLVVPPVSGPEYLDGDFDNGIIAHEYGHGISNRLTGGPSQADCLGNAEQMGEGWSDWFSLITSVRPQDVADTRRGVGTYVLRQGTDGEGIRRYPYTTDLAVNPITFATVAENPEVHALGEIWAAVTWDLYWAMVEKYGYDADLTNATSGNARAIQLVMDGMKLQPCSPGFIDGRDAIMLADMLNYDGADTCLITSVFARRGMGIGSSQGSNDNAGDGVENFDPIPTCVKELKIAKTSTPLINPGEVVTFTITITNHKDDAATGVMVNDELPAGLTFQSASNGGTFSNGTVTWNLGTVNPGQVIEVTYAAKSADGVGSTLFFTDPMETEDEWTPYNYDEEVNMFSLQTNPVKVGQYAWKIDDIVPASNNGLEYDGTITIPANRPVLRFWHQYNTEAGNDAGLVEISLDGFLDWKAIPANKVFRAPYSGKIGYQTFVIPFLSGFSGNSNGWVQSYMDLSDYAGQDVNLRFHFGTYGAGAETNGGWIVDGLEMMEMISFEGEACVTSAENDLACAKAPEGGTILNPAVVGTGEPAGLNEVALSVQPNPATVRLNIIAGQDLRGDVEVVLVNADGREAMHRTLDGLNAGQVFSLDVSDLPAGLYLLRLESATGNTVRKVMVK